MSRLPLAVISYAAREPFSPRGRRTTALLESLERDFAVELHASPAPPRAAHRTFSWAPRVRQSAKSLSERVLMDKYERSSRQHFCRWKPNVVGALLIGFPFSPLAYAAHRLRIHSVPYVVDLGDPWVLTNPHPLLRWPALQRAARAETSLWDGASGAILTTNAQAQALRALYPALPILVRPNGYDVLDSHQSIPRPSRDHNTNDTLSLVHFGDLYTPRVDITGFLTRLRESGHWKAIVFAQYGRDWSGVLRSDLSHVRMDLHDPMPWPDVVATSCHHDAAIVIGNRSSHQLPSKAIQYLTLPVPRVALTSGEANDALAQYVADKPGWLSIAFDDPRPADRLRNHLARPWDATDLEPPPEEAWPPVASEILAFVRSALSDRVPALQGPTVSTTEKPSASSGIALPDALGRDLTGFRMDTK
jgi:glycosyltransferase involved in cell wall biosynthesis